MFDAHSAATLIDVDLPFKRLKEKAIDEIERAYLSDVMARNRGNISRAARQAGISRQHLRTLLDKHGLRQG